MAYSVSSTEMINLYLWRKFWAHARRHGVLGTYGNTVWREGCAGLGQSLLYNTPEAQYEHLPRWLPERKIAFTAEARIDNRDVFSSLLNIPVEDRPTTADGDLILQAYLKWGEDCPTVYWETGLLPPGIRKTADCFWHATTTAIQPCIHSAAVFASLLLRAKQPCWRYRRYRTHTMILVGANPRFYCRVMGNTLSTSILTGCHRRTACEQHLMRL